MREGRARRQTPRLKCSKPSTSSNVNCGKGNVRLRLCLVLPLSNSATIITTHGQISTQKSRVWEFRPHQLLRTKSSYGTGLVRLLWKKLTRTNLVDNMEKALHGQHQLR